MEGVNLTKNQGKFRLADRGIYTAGVLGRLIRATLWAQEEAQPSVLRDKNSHLGDGLQQKLVTVAGDKKLLYPVRAQRQRSMGQRQVAVVASVVVDREEGDVVVECWCKGSEQLAGPDDRKGKAVVLVVGRNSAAAGSCP